MKMTEEERASKRSKFNANDLKDVNVSVGGLKYDYDNSMIY